MTNRISEYFEPGDGDGGLLPVSPLPSSSTDPVIITYVGRGAYAVSVHNPNTHHDGCWGGHYIGPLGEAIRSAERVLSNPRGPAGQLGEHVGIWCEEMIDIIMPDTEYSPYDDLSPGEFLWWVELNQYGPYPGDDWYHEKMDEQDELDLDDLNR